MYNFPSICTGRSSDFDGYWLFGFLSDLEHLTVNLLDRQPAAAEMSPVSVAIAIARQRFLEQMEKASLSLSSLSEASVEIVRLNEPKMGPVNGRTCEGRHFRFQVRAFSKTGKNYKCSRTIFIAPHNPKIEQRSTRRLGG